MPQHQVTETRRAQKSKSAETEDEAQDRPQNIENAELDQDVDDLLAEIDAVLEENAADFVRNYVQAGGQ